MTTIPADLLYFISPVNAPTYPVPEDGKIIVTEARDRDADDIGKIMPVTALWHDDLRLWYRGENGRYYDGPLIGGQVNRSTYALDIISDDDAVFGYINNTYTIESGKAYGMSYASRWSGKQYRAGGSPIAEHYGVSLVPVAPWASDLWPIPTDDDDLRAAKIALAKQKWETQIKHLAIIREAQRRDWLYILEQENFLEEHGMKRPIYGALISGHVSMPANQSIRADELSSRSQSHLATLSQFRTNPTADLFDAQVQVPVQFVYPGNRPFREGSSIYNVAEASDLTAHFQMASNNYEVTVQANSTQPTITGLSS